MVGPGGYLANGTAAANTNSSSMLQPTQQQSLYLPPSNQANLSLLRRQQPGNGLGQPGLTVQQQQRGVGPAGAAVPVNNNGLKGVSSGGYQPSYLAASGGSGNMSGYLTQQQQQLGSLQPPPAAAGPQHYQQQQQQYLPPGVTSLQAPPASISAPVGVGGGYRASGGGALGAAAAAAGGGIGGLGPGTSGLTPRGMLKPASFGAAGGRDILGSGGAAVGVAGRGGPHQAVPGGAALGRWDMQHQHVGVLGYSV